MSTQNKSPFGLRLVSALVLLWTLLLANSTTAQSCDELTILKIPALGRQASLGELFDERNGNFRKSNAFRSSVPKETITTTRRPSKITDFKIIRQDHQHTDKFHLLNVDENSAVNVLAGVLEVEVGASQFLTETSNATETNGALIFRQQTVTESLQSFYDALSPFYNRAKLNHNSATHIVTGIQWGGQAVVSVTAPVSQGQRQGRKEVENRMSLELQAFEQNQSFTNSSSYSFKAWEDVEFSVIIDGQLINNLSEALLTTADGKGVELEYTLTPLCTIRDFLEVPNLRDVAVERLNHSTLQGVLGIFDQIILTGQKLDGLDSILDFQSACVPEETNAGFQNLQNGFIKSSAEFKDFLEESLIKIRSRKMIQSNLAAILDEYNEGRFGAKNAKLMLAEFDEILKKISFYIYIQSKFKNIQYIGARGNLNFDEPSASNMIIPDSDSRESDASTRMYLLYYKHAWTVEQVDAWLENSQVFFGNLQKDASSGSWDFYVIDCDFGHLHCGNISQPTIHEYRNGKLTSSNYVVTAEETQTFSKALLQCPEGKQAICLSDHNCLNGGTFIAGTDDDAPFQCSCKSGYTGNKCEIRIDSCDSNPCQNNGWCQNRVNSYTCSCQVGFTGETCSVPVDWCALEEVPCKHGGTCRNKQLGFTCDCIAPWIGQSCEHKFEPCATITCLNGANCIAVNNVLGYVCQCRDGFNGPFCEIDIDECALNTTVCLNGGSCVDQVNGTKCGCASGYEGRSCEIDINECALNTTACLNGGSCVDQVNGFKCTCPEGFDGPFCEYSDCTDLPTEVLETQTGLKPVSLDCGGLIPFPLNQRYHLFTFESSKIDSTNNRCLWTFNSAHNRRRYKIKAKVTLLCSRFSDSRSHLSLHYFKPPDVMDDSLQTSKLTNSVKVVDLTDKVTGLFLSFISEVTNEPVQFTILVDAVQDITEPSSSLNSFNDVSGSQTFGPFLKYTVFSMAVNPAKARTTLSLNLFETSKTDACGYGDNLDVYEVSGKDEPKRLQRFCNPVTSLVSFTSEFPLLTLFYVYNDSTTNKQFKISWK